jgi:RecG-like helicase
MLYWKIVKFKNLGLAVIDEQHRFEVNNAQNYGRKI